MQSTTSSPIDLQGMVPAALMTVSEFSSASMVVPVRGVVDPSRLEKLEVVAQHRGRMEAIRKEASSAMRSMGLADLSAHLVSAFLDLQFQDDLWYCRLPNGKVVILVKEDVFNQLPEHEIAEQVHKGEVEAAIMRGEKVPDETVRYYRHKPPVSLAPVGY